jgi:hypothetical protein
MPGRTRRPQAMSFKNNMKTKIFVLVILIASALMTTTVLIGQKAQAQNTSLGAKDKSIETVKTDKDEWYSLFVTNIPPGYRDWKLISVAREEGSLDDIRAILANDIATKAYREGTLPFPEGAIIARIAWSYDASDENNKTFGKAQSFVAGNPKNGVQFMVRDSKKYAQTGGWGYAQFDDGKPAAEAHMQSCYPCHQLIDSRNQVFTRYAP